MKITPSARAVTDQAVEIATGHLPEHWFGLLDAAGATSWTHTAIARWLADDQGVPGWWAQGVTVRYEQARGMRQPGQQADGSFSVSASRTIDGPLEVAYAAVVARVAETYGEPMSGRASGARPYARFAATPGSLLVTVEGTPSGRVRAVVTRQKLPDAIAASTAKDEAAELLTRL